MLLATLSVQATMGFRLSSIPLLLPPFPTNLQDPPRTNPGPSHNKH
jgi:hypothetical protein